MVLRGFDNNYDEYVTGSMVDTNGLLNLRRPYKYNKIK